MIDHTLTLLELLAKATAVLLLGFGCIACLRRSSAAQRSLAWLAVFGALLLLPLAVFVRPVWTVSVPTVKQRVALEHNAPPVAMTDMPDTSTAFVPVAPVAVPWSIWQWLAGIYTTGVIAVLTFRGSAPGSFGA